MGLATIIAWSSLKRRPARTLFAVLGVALGIAIVVAIFTVDHNTLLHSRPDRDTSWTADLQVRPNRSVEQPLEALRGIEGVAGATEVLQADARLFVAGAEGPAAAGGGGKPVRVLGVDLEAARKMGLYRLDAGTELSDEEPERNAPVEAFVGRALAEQLGLEPGAEFAIARPQRAPRKACIEGELVQADGREAPPPRKAMVVAGVLAYEDLGRTGAGEVVVVPVEFARAVLSGSKAQSEFWGARDADVNLERLEQGLADGGFAYDLRRGSVVGQQADERAFRNGVRLAGLMALALGLFTIFHTLSMSLVERVREVGVLHALGTSRAAIGRAFLLEALFLSLTAGAVGLFGGLALANLMLENGITSLGITKTVRGQFSVPWPEALTLTGIGVSVALIGSVFPLLRAGQADTVRALRGEDLAPGGVARGFHLFAAFLLVAVLPAVFFSVVDLVGEESAELLGVVFLGVGVLALLVGTPLVVPGLVAAASRLVAKPFARAYPFAGLLASRSISTGATRVAASVAAIALVTAAFVGLRGMTRSLWLETENWAQEAAVDKVYVGSLPLTEWKPIADALRVYPGVIGVESATARVSAPFRVMGADPDEIRRYGPLAGNVDLLAQFQGQRALIASRRLAKQRGLEVDDVVPMATPDAGVQEFRVIAISDAYGYFRDPHERAYAVIHQDALEDLFCLDVSLSDGFAVRLEHGVDPDLVAAAVRSELPDASQAQFNTGATIRNIELEDIGRDFLVFDVILALTGLLAGVGVLNGLLLAAAERTKELGVLRALGASSRQIAGSVVLESSLIGLSGGLLGLALGMALVPVVVTALRVLSGLELPQPGPRPELLLAPVFAVILALLAGLYPIWRMIRTAPTRAVRTA